MSTSHVIESVRRSLAQAPRIIEGLVAAAPVETLTWREADGAWNVVEVLGHLADGEVTNWMPRVERILSGGGRFTPFDREAGSARYRGWTAELLVGEFGQLRRANLEKLETLRLTPPHLMLIGEHPEFGPVTLEQLLSCWATHDMAHVAQISRLLTRAFGRDVGPWKQYFSLLSGETR
ncbi:MAG: DinB family protein [Vicinamibacterales bacterium]